ncbi:hypothetical protein F5141DRAFT_1064501 [Pisolithus sp. B1]|nr:hypothetical protein F5141DRAFT_1064501 [Pisolithus sp. B1]
MDLNVLHSAFIAPYYSKAMDTFYKYLEDNNRKFAHGSDSGSSTYYSKFCSIVQSSGTRKSHLLFELRTKGVIVLYINLQPSNNHTGFLEWDDVPAEILTQPAVDYNAQCCTFFAAVFVAVHECLSASSSLEDALKAWNDSMCNLCSEDRKQFFTTLEAKYMTYYKEMKQMGQATEGMSGQEIMINAYQEMVNLLDELFHGKEHHQPKFVIALDDAHTIALHETNRYHLLTDLCRAINLYSGADRAANHAVWVIFTSSWPLVANFDDFIRLSLDGQWEFPPFYHFG